MHATIGNYKELFRSQFPLSVDRVDSPWETVPDETRYNRRAFQFIEYELSELKRQKSLGQRPCSRGILIQGEAGSGKTHLLMRIASSSSIDSPLLFIRRPTNEDAVAQHIWENIVESLRQPASKRSDASNKEVKSTSRLDEMLDTIFSAILVESNKSEGDRSSEQKSHFLEGLLKSKQPLRNRIGQGDVRQRNFKAIRNDLLNFIRRTMPNVDQKIAHVLITYNLSNNENYKRTLLNWLTIQELTEEEAASCYLPKSPVLDDGSQSQAAIQQARELYAFRCMQTLGELSTYNATLILAFDQLEGMRSSKALTARWGDVVRELFTMAPNYLVLTSVFPSIWESWFVNNLDESAVHRIAQTQVSLEQFQPSHATLLLAAHLNTLFSQHRLPNAIFPFTSDVVQTLCTNARSVRSFLQAARQWLLDWMFTEDEATEADIEIRPDSELGLATSFEIATCINDFLNKAERQHFNEYNLKPPSEQALYGKLNELAMSLFYSSDACQSKLTCGKRVLPAHSILCDSHAENQMVFAVCNANANSFSARVTNLLQVVHQKSPSIKIALFRDARLDSHTPSMKHAIRQLNQSGHKFIELDQESFAEVMALHDCLVAVQEKDLTAGGTTIDKDKLQPYLVERSLKSTSLALFTLRACLEGSKKSNSSQAVGESTKPSIAADDPVTSKAEVETRQETDSAKTYELSVIASSDPVSANNQPIDARQLLIGSSIVLGNDVETGQAVCWDVSVRGNPHLMIVGLPGMGKTTSLVNICEQLVERNVQPIVFSYHEDLDELLKSRLSGIKRVNHDSLGFNPLAICNDKPKAHLENAGMLRDIFSAIFPELGEIQTDTIRRAIKQSYYDAAGTNSSPAFKDFFQLLQSETKPDKGLIARLDELNDFGLFNVSEGAENLLDSNSPYVISLHGTNNEVVQRAFASLLLYRLYQEMFMRGTQDRITHAIIFDEAHRASKLNLMATMAKECRKYGISMIVASQEAKDFSPSMYSAIANYLIFRVVDQEAKALARNVSPNSSSKEVADSLKRLPKHEAQFFGESKCHHLKLASLSKVRSTTSPLVATSFSLQTLSPDSTLGS